MWLHLYVNTCCVWAGGPFFPVVLLCQIFFVVAGNSFRCYLPTIPVVPLCLVAQVSFLVVGEKSFRCYLLTNHTSCAIVSVFWFCREIIFGCTVSKKDSNLVSLRERGSTSKCVYFIRSNTLLLWISVCMDLQPYSHDRFSKISRTFFASRN
jgi:hypothetical protein